MAVSTKTIKSRLRSIGNTKKITKAMEMVSAAKMRKSVNAVLSSRHYSQAVWQMITNLSRRVNRNLSPLLRAPKKISKVAVVLITSNRGLCGGFNMQIINAAINHAVGLSREAAVACDWLVLGKIGGEFLARNNHKIVAQFDKADVITSTREIAVLAKMVSTDFICGQYDQVFVAYTDFVSSLVQKPQVRQLLPLGESAASLIEAKTVKTADAIEYLFEPSPREVLNRFLPRLIEVQLYQAVLESSASEHSARMMAMKNASEAALEMIDGLTLAYNQARQAGITREIAEISGGKAALE